MRLLLLSSFCFICLTLNGQIREGFMRFDVEVVSLDTSLLAAQTAQVMRDSRMMLFFDFQKARMDFKLGKISATSMRLDFHHNKGIALIANQDGRFAKLGSVDALIASSESGRISEAPTEVIALPEFKTILGYRCQKYLLKSNGVSLIYWCTNEIDLHDDVKKLINPNLTAFPLAFSVIQNNFKMSYQLTDISFELEAKPIVFSLEVPEGYLLIE